MRITGYGMIIIAALMGMFVLFNYLVTDVRAVEQSGPLPGFFSTSSYWYALIPATISLCAGLYMLWTRDRGYQYNYDLRRQQVDAP